MLRFNLVYRHCYHVVYTEAYIYNIPYINVIFICLYKLQDALF